MPETLERAQTRLRNISSIQPMLQALRTISLGSWQSSLHAQKLSSDYRQHLLSLIQLISSNKNNWLNVNRLPLQTKNVLVVLIGSSRGLCGNFNRIVVEKTVSHRKSLLEQGCNVELKIFGSVAARLLNHKLNVNPKILSEKVPPVRNSSIVGSLAYKLINDFDQEIIDRIDVIFNQSLSKSSYKPQVQNLIPLRFPVLESKTESWPSPIIDTNPHLLMLSIATQLCALDLHHMFLSSAIAEHMTRYQLMEEASSNAEGLIDELTEDIQANRRQTITQEMVELAVGSGLL